MTYQPTGARVSRFAKPGSLLIEIPELGNALFVSTDAAPWSQLPARVIPPRELGLSARFGATGDYVAATSLSEHAAQPGRSQSIAIALGAATALAAAACFAVAFVVVARRRRAASA
jgi:hypothetical protein